MLDSIFVKSMPKKTTTKKTAVKKKTTAKEKPTKKTAKKTSVKLTKEKAPAKDKNRYIEGIGRRKRAIARVRIYPSTNKPLKDAVKKDKDFPHILPAEKLDITVNEKQIAVYFRKNKLCQIAISPFTTLNVTFKASIKIQGGGEAAQAEAIRLGFARALNTLNEKWRAPLKAAGFLKRDSRKVERKKPGLRKARRPQQWRKR